MGLIGYIETHPRIRRTFDEIDRKIDPLKELQYLLVELEDVSLATNELNKGAIYKFQSFLEKAFHSDLMKIDDYNEIRKDFDELVSYLNRIIELRKQGKKDEEIEFYETVYNPLYESLLGKLRYLEYYHILATPAYRIFV